MIAFGGSPAAVEKMWKVPGQGSSPVALNPNPTNKVLAHLCEDFYRQQLHPGRNLDVLQARFLQLINERMMTSGSLSDRIIVSSLSQPNRRKTVSLLGWCREVLLDAATRSFFGDRLLQIEPDLFEKYFDFDDDSWQITYKLPAVFTKRMTAAKNAGIDALTRYFRLPKEERLGEAWLVSNLEGEMRNVGIAEPDIAVFVMMIYWVYVILLAHQAETSLSPSANKGV